MPDLRHGPTLLNGCLSRFAATPPQPDRTQLRRLRKHVRWRVEQLFKPLMPGEVPDVPTWLAGCPYPEWRKKELLDTWYTNHGCLRRRHYRVVSHGKRETYVKYKHARGINSRTDMFKCATGPYFKAIEEVVYKHPAFIKHTPVRQRPALIKEVLGGFPGPFYETDYSQFEKHFTPEVMESLEMILYAHMLKNYPEMLATIREAMLGRNKCCFGKFRLDINARRMSGEMCTSLGNGFSNFMLADFLATQKGGRVTGFVEGDDGLFFSSVPLTAEDFRALGFEIKILLHTNLLRTSFCGLVASEDLITMTDPLKVLLNFGWTHSLQMNGGKKVLDSLLKAKALSLAYEHPRCPILSVLATTVLSRLEKVRARFDTGWYEQHLNAEVDMFKEETAELIALGPSMMARSDFAEIFGISIHQQEMVEDEIRSWAGGQLDGPWTLALFGSDYQHARDYCERFTAGNRRSPCIN